MVRYPLFNSGDTFISVGTEHRECMCVSFHENIGRSRKAATEIQESDLRLSHVKLPWQNSVLPGALVGR